MENRLRKFDGTYRWFNSRGLPLKAADGEILRWYFLFFDVDDRRRAQENLAERERQLRRSEAFVAEVFARAMEL